MNEIIIKTYDKYNEKEIMEIYESVGWINYTKKPEMLKNAYKNSLRILGAYKDEKLVGIIRVVGDGHSIIYIQDILVMPQYQRMGIGSILLKKIMEQYANVYQKILLTENEPKTVEFYKSLGFTADCDMNCVAFAHYTV
ncbi:GNAT family N-acetyltransferase [Clostridiaceae bacterium M8S5]|nr:GNAT family N-acetyltransferase [Clostridiaceae bacterium M8S5]